MTGKGQGQRARDLELTDDLSELVHAAADSVRRGINTSAPGIVRSYDAASQTVEVTPVHKTLLVDEETSLEIPALMRVPVGFPRGGNFVLTFPIAEGDEVLLVFGQRTIDNWWDRGGVQDPLPVRFHSLSDAVAIPGLASRPRFVSGASTDAAELRTLDGTTVLRIEGSQIVLQADSVFVGGTAGAERASKGETLASILASIKTHTHILSGSAGTVAIAGTALLSTDLTDMDPNSILADKAKVL